MEKINVRDININDLFYHFTSKECFESIKKEGLVANIGDASKLVREKEPRVYLTKGGKGILGIKDRFIFTYKESRICDIPNEYRKYFYIKDWLSTEKPAPEDVYEAMERRLKDEVYLVVDAKEGEDFFPDEMYAVKSEENDISDIKGRPNHNISKEKLSMLITENGDTAFDVVKYLYNRVLELNPDMVDIIRDNLSSLTGMFDYIKKRMKKLHHHLVWKF